MAPITLSYELQEVTDGQILEGTHLGRYRVSNCFGATYACINSELPDQDRLEIHYSGMTKPQILDQIDELNSCESDSRGEVQRLSRQAKATATTDPIVWRHIDGRD